MAATASKLSFEEAMQQLELIVQNMEQGTMTLEESVEAYTRGIELANTCRSKLNAAEAKIRQLEADGTLSPLPQGKA